MISLVIISAVIQVVFTTHTDDSIFNVTISDGTFFLCTVYIVVFFVVSFSKFKQSVASATHTIKVNLFSMCL